MVTHEAPNCDICGKPLPFDQDNVLFKGKVIHLGCFKCATCGSPFSPTSTYYEKGGKPFCEKDYFGPKASGSGGQCARCGQALSGDVVEVNGVNWHSQCFVCYGCNRKFMGKSMKQCLFIDSSPYCDACGRKAFVKSMLSKRENSQQ